MPSKTPFRFSPYVVMTVVMAMYVLKVAVKLTVGWRISSPMITGDGFHNVADIVEVVLVVAAVFVARLPVSEKYPFGRKNIESIARAVIGVGLLMTALHFFAASLSGALSYAPRIDHAFRAILPLPEFHPLKMDAATLPWVLAVTGGSALLSFIIGPYEVRAGKANGHDSMVADGEETKSDGLIEVVTCLGVASEYLFHAPWLEYPFGMGVSFLVGHAGWELFLGGWRALLQRSIGREHEDAIRGICQATHGVREVETVQTFRVGSQIVCNIKICTSFVAAHRDLKHALKVRVSAYLKELSEDLGLYFRFSRPDVVMTRVAYAVVSEGAALAVAPSVEAATGFLICDLDGKDIVRWTHEPLPAACGGDLAEWLEGKRVRTLYLFGDRQAASLGTVTVSGVPSYSLTTLGLEEPEPIDD